MLAILQSHPQAQIAAHHPLAKSMRWGAIGGLAATLLMDLFLIGIFVTAGMPPFTCFSIVGETLARGLSLPGITPAGSIPLGACAHYLIGPLLGGIFGLTVVKIEALRGVTRHRITRKKAVLCAVLYAEIVSQPMLALTPILLQMTTSATLLWFGGSFGMHLIWGCVLGIVWSHELK